MDRYANPCMNNEWVFAREHQWNMLPYRQVVVSRNRQVLRMKLQMTYRSMDRSIEPAFL